MNLNDNIGIELFLFNPETEDLFNVVNKVDYVYLYNIKDYIKKNSTNGRAYLSDLSDYFSIKMPKLSKRIKKLEEKGYLNWSMDEDKERTYIEITNVARELLKEQKEKLSACSTLVYASIPEDELEITKSTLEKIKKIVHDQLADEDSDEEE